MGGTRSCLTQLRGNVTFRSGNILYLVVGHVVTGVTLNQLNAMFAIDGSCTPVPVIHSITPSFPLLQLLLPLAAGFLRTTDQQPNVTAVQAKLSGETCDPKSFILFDFYIVADALFIQTYPKLSWSIS